MTIAFTGEKIIAGPYTQNINADEVSLGDDNLLSPSLLSILLLVVESIKISKTRHLAASDWSIGGGTNSGVSMGV